MAADLVLIGSWGDRGKGVTRLSASVFKRETCCVVGGALTKFKVTCGFGQVI